ncbi:MAG: hypothetical protein ACTSV6_05525 [Candidatus Heimdallarchaeota archaeon]
MIGIYFIPFGYAELFYWFQQNVFLSYEMTTWFFYAWTIGFIMLGSAMTFYAWKKLPKQISSTSTKVKKIRKNLR